MKRTLIYWLPIVLAMGMVAVAGCTEASESTPASPPQKESPAPKPSVASPAPAAFTTGDLKISPTEVEIEETVTISVVVRNSGGETGSHAVSLELDGETVATEDVTVAANASTTVTFTTSRDAPGTYTFGVDDLSGVITVRPAAEPAAVQTPATFTTSGLTISPGEVETGESVTISILVRNSGDLSGSYKVTFRIGDVVVATKSVTLKGGISQKVSFTTDQDTAGSYTVDVNDLSGALTVKSAQEPVPATGGGTSLDVDARNFAFSPAQLTISVGETVTWTNQDPAAHTVTGDGWNSDTLNEGNSYSRTFNEAGTYTYGCDYHPGMLGTIIVE